MDGHARFRPPKEPLGHATDSLAERLGNRNMNAVYLADGPALWLRVMPLHDQGRTWLTQDLKQPALHLANLPLFPSTGSIGYLRGEDGGGYYSVFPQALTHSISYVFNTGELWLINAWHALVPDYIEFDETGFTKSLNECVLFLDRLGCSSPYQWVVGMEGIKNRQLVIKNQPNRTYGPCMTDLIVESGIYNKGNNTGELLRPFFEKVFDQFGARRPPTA